MSRTLPTVDVHAHVLPARLVEAALSRETRWGVEVDRGEDGRLALRVEGKWRPMLQAEDVYSETPSDRAARMSGIGVDIQILSLSPSLFLYLSGQADAVAFCSDVNEAVASFVAEQPERFRGFAFLPLEHPAAAVAELERMMATPWFVGAVAGTHVNGRDWDHPDLLPVLEAVEGMAVPLFIHPAGVRHAAMLPRHHLRNLIGNPLETTVAIASLVFGGVLDRFPSLRLCFAHGGGYGIFAAGRLDHGLRVRPELSAGSLPSEYLGRLWFDSLTHDQLGLRHLIDRAGEDRVLLGSDDPADMGLPRPVDWLESCDLVTEEERNLILGGNVGGLFGPRLADSIRPGS